MERRAKAVHTYIHGTAHGNSCLLHQCTYVGIRISTCTYLFGSTGPHLRRSSTGTVPVSQPLLGHIRHYCYIPRERAATYHPLHEQGRTPVPHGNPLENQLASCCKPFNLQQSFTVPKLHSAKTTDVRQGTTVHRGRLAMSPRIPPHVVAAGAIGQQAAVFCCPRER